MAALKADDFVKDVYASGKTMRNDAPTYAFDSLKAGEVKRLDEQHYSFMELMRDRLVHAPVERPRRLLDLCCGTGITTITIARKFPEAEVIGLDINPVPHIHSKPGNVTFAQARVEDVIKAIQNKQSFKLENSDMVIERNSFDYIFSRLLTLVIADWPALIQTFTSLLASGGWLEMQESANPDLFTAASLPQPLHELPNYTFTWAKAMQASAVRSGYDLLIGKHLYGHFLEQGLNEMTSVHYPWCFYPWPARPETSRIGLYMQTFGKPGLPAMLRMFGRDASEEDMREWEKQIKDIFDPNIGGEGLHWRLFVVCGRKK